MKSLLRITALCVLAIAATGCTTVAPQYVSNFDNVSKLRDAQLTPVALGSISKQSDSKVKNVDALTIRGGQFKSPKGSFTAYLQQALQQELDDARLLDPKSNIELTGVLTRNDIDAAGMSTGTAEIEARFTVKRDGIVRYEQTKSAKHQWESSFAGAVAIPKAVQSYPTVVSKLLSALYADSDFIAALKK